MERTIIKVFHQLKWRDPRKSCDSYYWYDFDQIMVRIVYLCYAISAFITVC